MNQSEIFPEVVDASEMKAKELREPIAERIWVISTWYEPRGYWKLWQGSEFQFSEKTFSDAKIRARNKAYQITQSVQGHTFYVLHCLEFPGRNNG